MPPTTRPISRPWRKACRCLLRRETKARRAAMRILAPRPMASASAPLPPRPTTWPSEEPISPIHTRAQPIPIGVRPTAPTYGSALSYIPEIPWNDSCAGSILAVLSASYSVGYGPERLLWKRHGATRRSTLQWPRAAEDPAGAPPAFRRTIWWWEAVARDTPNLPGKRGVRDPERWRAGSFPTYRSSPATESGATTT